MIALRPALAAALCAAVLTACSSATSGTATSDAHSPTSASTSPSDATSSSAGTSDVVALAARMEAASRTVTSAHLKMNVDAAGESLTGSGDEKIGNGKLTAMAMTETLPGVGAMEIRIVSGKVYLRLPKSLSKSDKPWSLVTASSSNPVVAQVGSSIDQVLSSADIGSSAAFVKAAASVKEQGPTTVGGQPATSYAVVVDVAKLPQDLPGMSALKQVGLTSIPVDLAIDANGRPVRVVEKFTVQGQTVSSTITISDYDQPVSIKAPPANQVSTD